MPFGAGCCRLKRKERRTMKTKLARIVLVTILAIPIFVGLLWPQESKITVLNPLGQPPAIERVPMAPRIDSLEGKTIYIVDTGFTDTHQFFTDAKAARRAVSQNQVGSTRKNRYLF